MNTVKDALAQKSGALIHVRSGDMLIEALRKLPVLYLFKWTEIILIISSLIPITNNK